MSIEEQWRNLVRGEIRGLQKYFKRQLTAHRIVQLIALVSTVSIAALAAGTSISAGSLGAIGALATFALGVGNIFQFQQSASRAQNLANLLEDELNLYVMGVEPYDGDPDAATNLFVLKVTALRRGAAEEFNKIWSQDPNAIKQPGDAADRRGLQG